MTVKELIEMLSRMDQSAMVFVPNGELSEEFVDLAPDEVRTETVKPTEWNDSIYQAVRGGASAVVIG